MSTGCPSRGEVLADRDYFPGTLCYLVAFGILLCVPWQFVVGSPGFMDPVQIKSHLLSGTHSQRYQLSGSLHLVIPKETRWRAKADIPCLDFDSVKISYTTLRFHQSNAVVEAHSQGCHYTYLIILSSKGVNNWSYTGTIPLWSRNEVPNIRFESLLSPGVNEIVVRNNETDYGTGILQTNMTIWKVDNRALRVIFDEPTSVKFKIPIGKGSLENSDQTEESQFTFVRPRAEENTPTSAKQILQKQTIHIRGVTVTRWWLYRWVSAVQRFRKEPTWPKS